MSDCYVKKDGIFIRLDNFRLKMTETLAKNSASFYVSQNWYRIYLCRMYINSLTFSNSQNEKNVNE